jgi:hypothetical protein
VAARLALDPDDVRADLARDWGRASEARARYWAERKARRGLAEVLRVADQLRASARALDPTWPTEAQREEDLATHQRVAAALALVPVARVRNAPRPRHRARPRRGR